MSPLRKAFSRPFRLKHLLYISRLKSNNKGELTFRSGLKNRLFQIFETIYFV